MSLEQIAEGAKDCLPYLAGGILLANQLGMHLLAFAVSLIPVEERKIKINMNKLKNYADLNPLFEARDYLNLASMLFHESASGNEDCTECSNAIFLNYKKLVGLNNREELLTKIRFAHGTKQGVGHEWLQIKHQGYFLDFECTFKVKSLTRDIPLDNESLEIINLLPDLYSSGANVFEGRTIKQDKFYLPTIRGFFNLGLVGTLIKNRKYAQMQQNQKLFK